MLGFAVPQFGEAAYVELARFASSVEQVAEAVKVLADNGYPEPFVDLSYVASTTDDHLEWVDRLLAP